VVVPQLEVDGSELLVVAAGSGSRGSGVWSAAVEGKADELDAKF